MKKVFYEIIDKKTKKVNIGLGLNESFYKSIGMIECNEDEVEQGCDGAWYLKGYAPQKPLKELKDKKIQELKNNCMNYIYSVYPIYKQLNIINPLSDYSNEYREEMNVFIDKNRKICKEKEELIKKAKYEEELKKINIDFNKE